MPVCNSISGTRAAAESTTIRSIAPESASCRAISKACSAVAGCATGSCSTATPRRAAYSGAKACSASSHAAAPPERCSAATIWRAKVVLPLPAPPNNSTIRPRGKPPPVASSSARKPVGIQSTAAGADCVSFCRIACRRSSSRISRPRRDRLPLAGRDRFRRRSFRRRRYRSRLRLDQPEQLAQLRVDGLLDVGVIPQELPRVLATLADPLAAEAEPRPALLDQVLRHAEVQQVAFFRNALAIDDVELRLAEGRRDLVLHHLDLGPVADHRLAVLDGRDAPDVEPHR